MQKGLFVVLIALALSGCRDVEDEAFRRGYNEGFDEGREQLRVEICEEVEAISPAVYTEMRTC